MRIRLQDQHTDPAASHATVRVFVNGASAGLLTVRKEELEELRAVLERTDGGNRGPREAVSS